jgi:hypothetical protein
MQLGRLRKDMYEFLKFQNLNYTRAVVRLMIVGKSWVRYLYDLDSHGLHEEVEAGPVAARR